MAKSHSSGDVPQLGIGIGIAIGNAVRVAMPIPIAILNDGFTLNSDFNCSLQGKQAREQILADGKIKGPKGPYVPFKRWDVGTPHETRSARQKAFHSDSWQ